MEALEIKKLAKENEVSETYAQSLYECLEDIDETEEFEELLSDGYTSRLQIQYDDDNYTGEPFNGVTRMNGGQWENQSPVLHYFTYKNKKHYIVLQA